MRDTCWGDVAGCLPSTNEAAALLLPDASVVSESRNGRYVVYSDRNAAYLVDSCLTASGWVPGCAPTSSTSPVMVSVDNAGNPCSAVGSASVSDDGHVAFDSNGGSNSGSTSGCPNVQNSQNNVPCGWGVFVRDTVGKHTYAVPPVPPSYNNNCAAYNSPSISGDGSVVAFQASVPKTSTRTTTKTYNDQIYIADMCWSGGCTPASTLISREASAFTSSSLTGAGDSTAPSISADGRKVAFVSTAYDLTDTLYWTPAISKTPAVPANIYSASTCAGSDSCVPASTLVSVGVTNGQAGLANNISASPAISNDGRYVAYNSSATNLVNGVGTTLVLGIGNGSAQQAFLNDQCTGTTAPSGCVGSTLLASSTPPGIPAIPSGAARAPIVRR